MPMQQQGKYPDDWIAAGYSKFNGAWIELGQSASVKCEGSIVPPELSTHDIPALLTELDELRRENERLRLEQPRV